MLVQKLGELLVWQLIVEQNLVWIVSWNRKYYFEVVEHCFIVQICHHRSIGHWEAAHAEVTWSTMFVIVSAGLGSRVPSEPPSVDIPLNIPHMLIILQMRYLCKKNWYNNQMIHEPFFEIASREVTCTACSWFLDSVTQPSIVTFEVTSTSNPKFTATSSAFAILWRRRVSADKKRRWNKGQ